MNLTWRIGALIASGLAGLFLVGLTTQTIRIEGFKIWPIEIVGFKEEVKTLRLDLDTIKAMQLAAKEKFEAEKLRQEQEYREQAERIDHAYQAELADANARIADYARRMRVQAPRSSSGRASPSPDSDASEGLDGSGEDAFVAVSREDFEILNENTLRLKAAHEWAIGLNE